MDTHRTDVTEIVAAPEPVATKPTKTRWWILILISLMYLICYMDRSNISVAQPEIAKQFGLSKRAMGLVLAAFTWAYALGQIPAGWLGDRFGPRKVLTVIMSWWACGGHDGRGVRAFLAVRRALPSGLGRSGRVSRWPAAACSFGFRDRNAGAFKAPRISSADSRWRSRRSLPGASCSRSDGARFSIFSDRWAWFGPSLFHFSIANLPEDHTGVNIAELAQIRGLNPDGTVRTPHGTRQATPWRTIFGSPNMWYIALGYGCFFFGTNFYLTWYPTYLREHRHLSLQPWD